MGKRKVWLAAFVAAGFVVVAIAGSVMLSHRMNRAADQGEVASTGRNGDPLPNTAQQQEHAKSSRGPSGSTSGFNNGSSAVPPAGR